MTTPSKRLRDLRKDANLLQTELAAKLNLSQFIISNLENGRTLSADELIVYAEYFGVSADYILGLTTSKSRTNTGLDQLLSQLESASSSEVVIGAQQVFDVLEDLIGYYKAGAPLGDLPMRLLGQFSGAVRSAMVASQQDNSAIMVDAMRAATDGIALFGQALQMLKPNDNTN